MLYLLCKIFILKGTKIIQIDQEVIVENTVAHFSAL